MTSAFFNFHASAVVPILAFLATAALVLLSAAATVALLLLRRRRAARWTAVGSGVLALSYAAALIGFSIASREQTVPPGSEKYFCEVDCHLAYSVVSVTRGEKAWAVGLKTRFDETTIASWRPRDLTLSPNPREAYLEDAAGRRFAARRLSGLDRALRPGESYVTELVFDAPADPNGVRLILRERFWATRLLVGHENSFLHAPTSLRLPDGTPSRYSTYPGASSGLPMP